MVKVLVNPQTKEPTCLEPGDDTVRIFTGPYQNVAEVSEEFIEQEKRRIEEILRSRPMQS